MKITEKDLRDWFPQSKRFLHYCAKYYGYSFHNNDVVDRAHFQAELNVLRLYNRGEEFEDEAHKIGVVMSCFRYAILNSYTGSLSANQKNLNMYCESDVTYGDDEDAISLYERALVSNDKDNNNLVDIVSQFIDKNLPYTQRECFKRIVFGDKTRKEVATDLDMTQRKVELAYSKAKTRVRNYVRDLHSKEESVSRENNNNKYITEPVSKLRIQMELESAGKDEKAERDYSEAMSFIHSVL